MVRASGHVSPLAMRLMVALLTPVRASVWRRDSPSVTAASLRQNSAIEAAAGSSERTPVGQSPSRMWAFGGFLGVLATVKP